MLGGPKGWAGSRKTNTFRMKKAEGKKKAGKGKELDSTDGSVSLRDVLPLLHGNDFILDARDMVSLVRTSSGMAKCLEDTAVRVDWSSEADDFVMRDLPKCVQSAKVAQLRTHLDAKQGPLLAKWAPGLTKLHLCWDWSYDETTQFRDVSTNTEKEEFCEGLFEILEAMSRLEYLHLELSYDAPWIKSKLALPPLENLKYLHLNAGDSISDEPCLRFFMATDQVVVTAKKGWPKGGKVGISTRSNGILICVDGWADKHTNLGECIGWRFIKVNSHSVLSEEEWDKVVDSLRPGDSVTFTLQRPKMQIDAGSVVKLLPLDTSYNKQKVTFEVGGKIKKKFYKDPVVQKLVGEVGIVSSQCTSGDGMDKELIDEWRVEFPKEYKFSFDYASFPPELLQLQGVNLRTPISTPPPFPSLQQLILDKIELPESFTFPPSLQLLRLNEVAKVKVLNFCNSQRLEVLEITNTPYVQSYIGNPPPEPETDTEIKGMHSLSSLKQLKLCQAHFSRIGLGCLSENLESLFLFDLKDVVNFGVLPRDLKELYIEKVFGLQQNNSQAHCINIEAPEESEDEEEEVDQHLLNFPGRRLLLPLTLPSNLEWLSLDTDVCFRAAIPSNLKTLCILLNEYQAGDPPDYLADDFFKFQRKMSSVSISGSYLHSHLPLQSWRNIVSLEINGNGECFGYVQKVSLPPGLLKLRLVKLDYLQVFALPDTLEELVMQECYQGQCPYWGAENSIILRKGMKKLYMDTALKSLTLDGCTLEVIHMHHWSWRPPTPCEGFNRIDIGRVICRNGATLPKDFKKSLAENGHYSYGVDASTAREKIEKYDRYDRYPERRWKIDLGDKF